MSIKDFFEKIVSQGYLEKGESFEGCSNLDEGFSKYIEKLFTPWNLCSTLDHIISSGKFESSTSYLDILCYKTKDFLIENENLLAERDSDVSKIQYPYSFDYYAPDDFAIFARHDGVTEFLGLYFIDSQKSVDTNKLTYKLISSRLYIDYSDNSGIVYLGKYRGMNAKVVNNPDIEEYKIIYTPIPIDLNLEESTEYSAIIDLCSRDYEELHNYIIEKKNRPHLKAPYIKAMVNKKISKQVEETTGDAQNYIIKNITKLD